MRLLTAQNDTIFHLWTKKHKMMMVATTPLPLLREIAIVLQVDLQMSLQVMTESICHKSMHSVQTMKLH